MLKDKVDAIAKHGDELNRNKIDKSSIELENADSSEAMSIWFCQLLFDCLIINQNP